MKKQDFIKMFHLIKGEKNYFIDGYRRIERVVYYNEYGNNYIFYDNDLCGVNLETHHITGCYSWYH